jgi:hypothetical protein
MKTTLRFLFLSLASLLLLQCDDNDSPKIDCNRETFVASVSNVDAKIRFDSYFKAYVVSVPNMDGATTGLVCDLQKELKKDGLAVVFDGSYYEYHGETGPRVGGDDFYYLEVSKITAK